MKLEDLKFTELLPEWMRDDPVNIVLSDIADEVICDITRRAKLFTRWDRIDELPEETLDELAKELGIDWYLDTADIETKRQLVKASDAVHAKLGTAWAVKNIIDAYFGDSKLIEWFEYGGAPGCFRIVTGDSSITNERAQEFLRILEIVKRKSALLDGIYVTLTGRTEMMHGAVVHESTVETHRALIPEEG